MSEHVVVADQPEVDLAVVGHQRHAERLAAASGTIGKRSSSRAPTGRAGTAARDVRDHEVEQALPRHQRAAWAMIVGGAKPDRCGEHLGADRLTGLLQVCHRSARPGRAARRVLAPDGQRGHHRRHLVAERAALHLGAHAHRDHRLQLEPVGVVPAAAQVPAERAGDGGEHHVVDGAAERVLDRLDVAQLGAHPGEAAVRADRRRCTATRGRRVQAAQAIAPTPPAAPRGRRARGAGRGTRRARCARPRPGTVARSSSASPSSCARDGSGRGSQRLPGAVGAAGSGEVSNSTVTMSMPETPSTSAWWVFDEQREAVVLEALDEPDLPERLVAVELLREHAAGEVVQLLLRARRGQRGHADVVAEVEVRVVDPARAALAERHVREPLAVARHEAEPASIPRAARRRGEECRRTASPTPRACGRRSPRCAGRCV